MLRQDLYRVRGLAVAGIAAQGLQDSTGIKSGTLMSFFNSVEKTDQERQILAAMDAKLARGGYAGTDHAFKKSERDRLAARIEQKEIKVASDKCHP